MREYSEALGILNALRDRADITHAVHRRAVDCLDKWARTNSPMPKIWLHGPYSVVFEWDTIQPGLTHCLTVGAHSYSLVVSNDEKIEWRLDLP